WEGDVLIAAARPASLKGIPRKSTGVGSIAGGFPRASVKFLATHDPDRSKPSGTPSPCERMDTLVNANVTIAIPVTRHILRPPARCSRCSPSYHRAEHGVGSHFELSASFLNW